MKKIILVLLLSLIILCGCGESELNANKKFEVKDTLEMVQNKTCKVILLYGQSNATGCSYINELEKNNKTTYDEYNNGYDNVKINFICENGSNSSHSEFVTTRLGQGFSTSAFGPEVGIAQEYNKAYPNDDIFIIKYSWGGSILDSQWLDENYNKGELYEAAINFTKTSLNYLLSKGYTLDIQGICWMQGESDAFYERPSRYEKNTDKLVSFFREDLKSYSTTIKFIDAYIEDIDLWTYYEKINQAKYNFSQKSELNYCIDTISLGLTTANEPEESVDLAHYDSLSMVLLGQEFGKTLINSK